jgi:hypothetical protein
MMNVGLRNSEAARQSYVASIASSAASSAVSIVNSLNTTNEGLPETELPLWIVGKPYSAIHAMRLIVLVLTIIDLKLKQILDWKYSLKSLRKNQILCSIFK